MKFEVKKLKTFVDSNGSLTPVYSDKTLKKFKIKRFFFLECDKNHIRANHAHKKCDQIYILVSGEIYVQCINKKKIKSVFILNERKKKILFIPKYTWTKITFKKNNSKLLVLCNYKYDRTEYIEDLECFLNLKS